MTFSPQKLASYLLLTIYGGIAVLGHGLHELSPAHHHHAAHEHTASTCAYSHHHHGHSDTHERAGALASAHAIVSDGHAHNCEICDFLDQQRSFPTQLHADVFSQPFTVAVSLATPRIESLAISGLYAPRGPPAHVS